MIVHADINSCYAACEQVFNPRLRGRPVVVLSNNDGCVVARSAEAKAIGVQMGEPWHLCKAKYVPMGVVALSSNYALYGDMSRRVMDTLRSFAERMEIYSIDEAFLDFSPGGDPLTLAREIRATVRRHTGLSMGLGVAPTKVLAKAANRIAKSTPEHGGVFAWPTGEGERTALLQAMKPSQVWGIAGALERRLAAMGITDVAALAAMPEDLAHRQLTVVGLRIVLELRGHSCISFEDIAPAKKSLIVSRSFGQEVATREELEESVARHAETAAAKLRAQSLHAERIEVFVSTNPFKAVSQHHQSLGFTFDTPANFSATLIAAARACARKLFRAGYRYKKAGVMLFGLGEESTTQLAFESEDAETTQRKRRLMGAVDMLNRLHGRGAVRHASVAARPRWAGRADHCSPRYTTRLEDIPVAYAR